MSRLKDPTLPPEAIVGLKVETEPVVKPQDLAIQLVESIENASLHRNNAKAFREHSQYEGGKIRTLNDVLFQLKERKRNPPVKVSRMDPLGEYNVDMIHKEIQQAKERQIEFANKASKEETLAVAEDGKTMKLQKDIRELNAQLRQKGS